MRRRSSRLPQTWAGGIATAGDAPGDAWGLASAAIRRDGPKAITATTDATPRAVIRQCPRALDIVSVLIGAVCSASPDS